MTVLGGKKIILGITGSIAAYKAALLTRMLVKKDCEVRVIMTEAAKHFITPLTLSTLSKNPVLSNLMDGDSWNSHVDLGLWADVMLIAPATANTLGRMANGIADNLLIATYLSAKCPVFFAPAMDLDMWKHQSTKNNIHKLKEFGNIQIDVEHGELASGLVGEGRMAEPEHIILELEQFFPKKKDLINKTVLITAGPTFEDLDPVRFIGNRSSGKMGVEIADEVARRGGSVILIQGPGAITPKENLHKYIRVRSAEDMFQAVQENSDYCDAFIMAAAVADYSPDQYSNKKIKKSDDDLSLPLKRTKDIAAFVGKNKNDGQFLIGFALETNNAKENALKKLRKKNMDFIVLNSLEDKGAGFAVDTNKIAILHKNGESKNFPLKTKKKVASDIIDELVALF